MNFHLDSDRLSTLLAALYWVVMIAIWIALSI